MAGKKFGVKYILNMYINKKLNKMYLMKRRRSRRKIRGKGIKRPYISKRNCLMLGKGKQKGGFIGPIIAAAAPALLQTIGAMFKR